MSPSLLPNGASEILTWTQWHPGLITPWSLQDEIQAVLMFSKEMEGV